MTHSIFLVSMLLAAASGQICAQCLFTVQDISEGNRDSSPETAYNSRHDSWLTAWTEAPGRSDFGGRLHWRLYTQEEGLADFVLDLPVSLEDMGRPRVSYDPLRNLWYVVFSARSLFPPFNLQVWGFSLLPDGSFWNVVTPITPGVDGAVNPDVSTGESGIGPFLLVVWEEERFDETLGRSRRGIYGQYMRAGNFELTRLSAVGDAFPIDAGDPIPADSDSSNPRLSKDSPIALFLQPAPSPAVRHAANVVTFTVETSDGADIYAASVMYNTSLGTGRVESLVRVTSTPEPESHPVVAFDPPTARTLIVFERGGSSPGGYGQYLRPGRFFSGPTSLNLDGSAFRIGDGDQPDVDASSIDDSFHVAARTSGTVGSVRLTGTEVIGSLGGGRLVGAQPSVASSDNGGFFLAFTEVFRLDSSVKGSQCVTGPEVPDDSESPFVRGDANVSGDIDLSDGVSVLAWLFSGGTAPKCPDAADVNDDGSNDVSDAVYLFDWLFLGGPQPVDPGPRECGDDPSPDRLGSCRFDSC